MTEKAIPKSVAAMSEQHNFLANPDAACCLVEVPLFVTPVAGHRAPGTPYQEWSLKMRSREDQQGWKLILAVGPNLQGLVVDELPGRRNTGAGIQASPEILHALSWMENVDQGPRRGFRRQHRKKIHGWGAAFVMGPFRTRGRSSSR